MKNLQRRWSEQDIEILRINATNGKNSKELSIILKRNRQCVNIQARKYNIPIVNSLLIWTKDRIAAITKLAKNKLTIPEIAETLGYSKKSVQYVCHKHKIKIGNRHKWDRDDINHLIELIKQKKTLKEISIKMELGIGAIQRQMRNLKIFSQFKRIKHWTPQEIEKLKKLKDKKTISYEEISRIMKRTQSSVKGMSYLLGLSEKDTFWTREEEEFLRRRNANNIPILQIAKELNKTKALISGKMQRMGIMSQRGAIQKESVIFCKKYNRSELSRIISVRFSSCRSRSEKMGWKFEIDREFLLELFHKQKGICAYTGIKMTTNLVGKNIFKVSVDRIDSSKGYIKGNIVLCCHIINIMKQDLKKQQFIDLCKMVIEWDKQ